MRTATRSLLASLAIAVSFFACGGEANANFAVNGTIPLSASFYGINTNDIRTASIIAFRSSELGVGDVPFLRVAGAPTGDFARFAGLAQGYPVATQELFIASPQQGMFLNQPFPLDFSGLYGSFTGTVVSTNTQSTAGTTFFRNIVIEGTFFPGQLPRLLNYTLPSQARFVLNLSQQGLGGVISGGATLIAVPEPASVTLVGLGLGLVGSLVGLRRRLAA